LACRGNFSVAAFQAWLKKGFSFPPIFIQLETELNGI
jgi:hypothetical protein